MSFKEVEVVFSVFRRRKVLSVLSIYRAFFDMVKYTLSITVLTMFPDSFQYRAGGATNVMSSAVTLELVYSIRDFIHVQMKQKLIDSIFGKTEI